MIKRVFSGLLVGCVLMLSCVAVAAQRPDAPAFAAPGEYMVGAQNYVVADDARPLNATIWYPSESGGDSFVYMLGVFPLPAGQALKDVAPDMSGAPYPLVVFSHGSGGTRLQSIFFAEHLASRGFVVIAVDHPTNTLLDEMQDRAAFRENLAGNYIYRPQDITRALDSAETLTAEGGAFAGLIDMEKVAAAGHSFGGYTALAVAGGRLNYDSLATYCSATIENPAQRYTVCFLLGQQSAMVEALGLDSAPEGVWPSLADARIKAVVALAPWNGPLFDSASLGDITIPALLFVGTNDQITPPERDAYTIFSNLAQAPRALVTLENAGHFVYVDACAPVALQTGLFDICSDSVWDMARAHDLINHFTTAFLRATFYDDPQAAAALQPGAVDFAGVTYVAQNLGARPEMLLPQVIASYPHDVNAFTQGLLLHEGTFYESTGRRGFSTLRQVDPETGEVLRSVDVDSQYFAEGLALVEDRLIQLTWQAGLAFVYDLDTFEQVGTFTYTGEGWGLCYDGEWLYRSDGSDLIFIHNPDTFAVEGEIAVSFQGESVSQINELECVGDAIYANVWQTDFIVRIDKATGYITGVVNAAGLLTPQETAALGSGGVLNGIAYDTENDRFFITGKLWPKVFEVQFVAR